MCTVTSRFTSSAPRLGISKDPGFTLSSTQTLPTSITAKICLRTLALTPAFAEQEDYLDILSSVLLSGSVIVGIPLASTKEMSGVVFLLNN